jgi:hypothetical protein
MLLTYLGLQVRQAALKADDGENWHGSFLKADTYWYWVPSNGVQVLYMGYRFRVLQGLILIDAVSSTH